MSSNRVFPPTPVLKNAGAGVRQSSRRGLLHDSQVFRLPLENRSSSSGCKLETVNLGFEWHCPHQLNRNVAFLWRVKAELKFFSFFDFLPFFPKNLWTFYKCILPGSSVPLLLWIIKQVWGYSSSTEIISYSAEILSSLSLSLSLSPPTEITSIQNWNSEWQCSISSPIVLVKWQIKQHLDKRNRTVSVSESQGI